MKTVLSICITLFLSLSVFAQQQTATPKSGEGINAFLERNGFPSKTYLNEFMRLNEKKLKGKHELQLGVNYLLPAVKAPEKAATASKSDKAPRMVKQKLFGKELAKVEVTGNSLKGACFYVVSGHGGPDPGAIGWANKHELHEDEYAYDVALRLARNLIQEGAEVRILINDAKDGIRNDPYLSNSKRETCMGKKIPLNQVERLQQRATVINNLYAKDRKKYRYCRAIFLHVDSRSRRERIDVFFYHAKGSKNGKKLAEQMKKTFTAKYRMHQPNRGFEGTVSPRGLYVLNNTTPAALFVELGNIQNSMDQRRFIDYNNRQALANWMTEGFIKDYQK